MKILSSPQLYNFNRTQNKKHTTSFNGTIPASEGIMSKIEGRMAKGILKFLDTPFMEKIVKGTEEHKGIANNLTPHLIVLGSTALSGFYVLKTFKNKQMDEDKRKTLAINQALVWAVSTAMAYTFDGWAKNQFDEKILKRFEKANKLNTAIDKKRLESLKAGMNIARPIIIVDMVYRFIAPVIITPFANAIGNKIKENRKAELAKTHNNQKLNANA